MFQRILVPVDLSEPAICANVLSVAEGQAKAHGAELHVLTVVPNYTMSLVGSFFPEGHLKTATDAARKALGDMLVTRGSELAIKGHVAAGTIYEEIMRAADKLSCDLIVIAAHRPELKDYLLGPNAARVVRHAKQSVFVVRNRD